jgi:repressor LexA
MSTHATINETDFGERIRELREAKKYTLRQAAMKMDLSPSYLSNLENKKSPSDPKPATLDKIAYGLHESADTIYRLAGLLPKSVTPTSVGTDTSRTNTSIGPQIAKVKIPVYGEIHAGNPTYADENVIGHIATTEKFLSRYGGVSNIFALRIKGDSMSRVVPEGYTAIFAKGLEVTNGDIVAVLLDGDEATIKRYKETSMAYIFEPDSYNPIHHEITISKHKADTGYCKILGKYLYATSEEI